MSYFYGNNYQPNYVQRMQAQPGSAMTMPGNNYSMQPQNQMYGTQPMMQTSQPQPMQQPSYIQGRVINTENDILPNEVPNDGNFAVFVQGDMQRIYAKTWGKDGLIQTEVFERVNQLQPQEGIKEDPFGLIMERLDNIEKMVKNQNRYQKPYKKPYNKPADKEEVKHE